MPGGWRLQADVPDGIFSLAVEADDQTATAEHAAFAQRCMPLLLRAAPDDAERHRADLITQLSGLRQAVKATGMSYLGAIAGPHRDRAALIVLGVAAMPMEFPGDVDAASLLAALARHRYPGAAVEEFETLSGTGVGIRRCESQPGPFGENKENAGVAEALVPFPEAGMLGAVTGYSYMAEDIDLAATFTALIACRMRAVTTPESPAAKDQLEGRQAETS
jgi:hypothetical protein